MEKLIITAALTGGIHGKEANPALPEQPDEIIRDAVRCHDAGAAVVHLHARDRAGKGVADARIFREMNEGIRARCGVIIQNTTGGPGLPIAERITSLDAAPEMASLNMGSVVFFHEGRELPFINLRSEIEAFAAAMLERGIKPEMEVYSHAMLRDVQNLIDKGLVKKPYYIDLVLGMRYQGACDATPKILLSLIDMLPADAYFNCAAVGPAQLPLTTLAMLMGGCVRVGLEDNAYYRKGELASNAEAVARIMRIARELGKEPATPDEARQILGLPPLKK